MRSRKTLLSALPIVLAVLVAACGGPRVGDVHGRIVDEAGRGLAGATVRLGSTATAADDEGNFSFVGVELGTYELEARAPGRAPYVAAVTVGSRPTQLEVVLERIPFPPGCEPREGDPELPLVYCQTFAQAESLEEIGWHVGSGEWRIVEAAGKRWIEGASDGGQRWAYVEIPELADARRIVVEFTGTYVSAGNTWALQFPADTPEQAHGSTFMVLSAWDGVYFRRYHENLAVAESTIISPPKLMTDEVVTLRISYDSETREVDMLRNGQRPFEYPVRLPEAYLLAGSDQTLLKLYVNVGGAAGDTVARWTDIRVWAE
ncbi:MAG: carboxypeptidase regulatory-like domain-containing protein [Firmicutes bacterium]|nr:carboxypeptidase regulatory-like domain-containing protein [Bacillota bacterium]